MQRCTDLVQHHATKGGAAVILEVEHDRLAVEQLTEPHWLAGRIPQHYIEWQPCTRMLRKGEIREIRRRNARRRRQRRPGEHAGEKASREPLHCASPGQSLMPDVAISCIAWSIGMRMMPCRRSTQP